MLTIEPRLKTLAASTLIVGETDDVYCVVNMSRWLASPYGKPYLLRQSWPTLDYGLKLSEKLE